MSYVGFGVPWTALGLKNLWKDSGFLCIYEPLCQIYRQTGNRSIIYLDKRHKPEFEHRNNPEESGVYPVFSQETRCPHKALDQPVDDAAANEYLDGLKPVDFILTNKNYVLPHLSSQALASKGFGVPVIYVCLNAGKDSVAKPVGRAQGTFHDIYVNCDIFPLYMEAATYLAASYVVWTTENQRKRGLEIAKRFLAPVEVGRLKRRSMVNGCGITDLIRPYKKTDEEVGAWLQSKKDDFSVSFLGRATRNKNLGYILDTMQPLFAKHGIKLDMKTSKQLPTAKRFADNDDPNCMIDTGIFDMCGPSREEYASTLLPSIKCMMYASIAEGYCITPREAVYIGIPVLVPKRAWALTAFGPDYPFYYESHTEAFSLIRRIADGNIRDDEISRFIATRDNGYTCEFLSDVSMKLFKVCKDLVEFRRTRFMEMSHSRFMAAFESCTQCGMLFQISELYKQIAKNGVSIGFPHARHSVITPQEAYAFIGDRLECINPAQGLFKRIV